MIILIVILIVGVFVGAFFFCKSMEKKCAEDKTKPIDNIKSVTVIGTRAGEQTKIFATYNFTIYSFLVEYESGKREVIETEANSEQFNELIKYIKTDKSEETK